MLGGSLGDQTVRCVDTQNERDISEQLYQMKRSLATEGWWNRLVLGSAAVNRVNGGENQVIMAMIVGHEGALPIMMTDRDGRRT